MNLSDVEPSSDDATNVSFVIPLLVSLALAALLAAGSYWVYGQLPADARVPIHWNGAGQVDRYAGRASVFLLPAVVAGISALMYGVPYFEPRRAHLLRSSRAYRWVWLSLVVFLSGLHVLALLAAMGRPVAMDRWVMAGVGLLFIIVGNFFGKIRSNFVFGLRTPWTLSSDLSWNRTHRLAGWLFVVSGVALVVAVLAGLHGKPLMTVLFTSLGACVVVPTIYSFIVWRSDPHRRS